jgi:hypothetical protein
LGSEEGGEGGFGVGVGVGVGPCFTICKQLLVRESGAGVGELKEDVFSDESKLDGVFATTGELFGGDLEEGKSDPLVTAFKIFNPEVLKAHGVRQIETCGMLANGVGPTGAKISKYLAGLFEKMILNKKNYLSKDIFEFLRTIPFKMATDLMAQKKFNALHSGAELTSFFILENLLYIQNLGNIKLYIIYQNSQSQWRYKKLTTDHSLHPPSPPSPPSPHPPSPQNPLTSTRLIGLFSALKHGISFQPTHTTFNLKKHHKMLFIANNNTFKLGNPEIIINRICNLYGKSGFKGVFERLETSLRTTSEKMGLEGLDHCFSLTFLNNVRIF